MSGDSNYYLQRPIDTADQIVKYIGDKVAKELDALMDRIKLLEDIVADLKEEVEELRS